MGSAYLGPFPIRSHRSMAEVMADEANARACASWATDDLAERLAQRSIAAGSAQLLSAIQAART